MISELRVREAGVEDAGRLYDVLRRAFVEYEGRLDPPSGVHSETAASLARKIAHGGALLCEAGGAAIGCAVYEPFPHYLYVGRFGVVPEARGRRAGDLLLEAAEARARALGYREVRLNVRLVLDRLRGYYEARDYAPIDYLTHEGYPGPTYVQMRKLVTPPALG
jgi:GNAT superfamily N-acetyltransferase